MSKHITLPRPVQDTINETDRIKKKIKELGRIGASEEQIKALNKELKISLDSVNEFLGVEARKEIKNLPKMAEQVANDLVEDKNIEKNEDLNRLKDVDNEKKKIAEKLKVARKHRDGLDDENEIKKVERGIKDLDDAIREAAIEAAKRELKEIKEEIDNIKNGKPKKDDGNGPAAKPKPKPKPKPKDKDKKGGATGGDKKDDKDKDGNEKKEETTDPTIHTIYVRGETRVWAWNPRILEWVEMEFNDQIIDVKLIKGGILAFSKIKAAIYDSYIGVWLNALDVQNGNISEGDAKTDN